MIDFSKQQQFINNISQRLGRPFPSAPPAHPFKGAPDYWKSFDLPLEERIALLMENWRKSGGEARRFADLTSARAFIAEVSRSMKARYFVRYDHEMLNELALEALLPDGTEMTVWNPLKLEQLKRKAAEADIGIIVADYAVAYTGSVVVASSETKGRSVSLLPAAVMMIVPAEVIRTRLGEVMEQISAMPGESMPAGIHFISGPSRSADIENDLTIGVHGPGIVYLLIIG
ncbi:LutC/YkgG family protein [Ferviditalea candida]|uniref:Lactate utilization protein n=1 Tax=Ferviditalea candida TaxID=3108399 RepID=A0ABU5ZG83_9BACL|nr:lactate utilization protein [Paenibacillaceae bacterium T2]